MTWRILRNMEIEMSFFKYYFCAFPPISFIGFNLNDSEANIRYATYCITPPTFDWKTNVWKDRTDGMGMIWQNGGVKIDLFWLLFGTQLKRKIYIE